MAQPRGYQFRQRPGGRGAVVRISETGGAKVIAVYNDQATADRVARLLDGLKDQEA